MKKTYNKCGHTTSEYIAIPKELVNKTKRGFGRKNMLVGQLINFQIRK